MPLTTSVNKHLLPVFDKPMIYYPLTTLILAGVKQVCIVVNPEDVSGYRTLLWTGRRFGLEIELVEQDAPLGIAHAIKQVPVRFRGQNFWVILGDNFFFGRGLGRELDNSSRMSGCTAFGYSVGDPSAYGVATFKKDGSILRIVEKPSVPWPSNFAVPGLYRFDPTVFSLIESLELSERGELEVTDLLNVYAKQKTLDFQILPRGTVWMDLGSHEMLLEASNLVRMLQSRSGMKIGDPVEAAIHMGTNKIG